MTSILILVFRGMALCSSKPVVLFNLVYELAANVCISGEPKPERSKRSEVSPAGGTG